MAIIGGGVHILSKRFQRVNVVTLSTLREHLEAISTPEYRFKIEKVRGDELMIAAEDLVGGGFTEAEAKDIIARITPSAPEAPDAPVQA